MMLNGINWVISHFSIFNHRPTFSVCRMNARIHPVQHWFPCASSIIVHQTGEVQVLGNTKSQDRKPNLLKYLPKVLMAINSRVSSYCTSGMRINMSFYFYFLRYLAYLKSFNIILLVAVSAFSVTEACLRRVSNEMVFLQRSYGQIVSEYRFMMVALLSYLTAKICV